MTVKVVIFTQFIFALLLPITSLAAIYDPILEQTKPGTITIIGETHKKTESVELFQSLALDVAAKRNELHTFAVIPKRWVVERSFAWLEKCRRLWKNCEGLINTSLQMVVLAFLAFLLKRI